MKEIILRNPFTLTESGSRNVCCVYEYKYVTNGKMEWMYGGSGFVFARKMAWRPLQGSQFKFFNFFTFSKFVTPLALKNKKG